MFERYVPAQGDMGSATVAVVGEQPGVTEVFRKIPFCGASGRPFRDLLRLAGFTNELYFTNVIKDLDDPLETYIHKPTKGNPIYSEQGRVYQDVLIAELAKITNLRVIIAVGNVALFALTGRWGITKWRGSIIPCLFHSALVIPVIHPATMIPPKCVYTNRYLILHDCVRAFQLSKRTLKMTEPQTIIAPTFEQVMDFLNTIEQRGLAGEYIGFDTEIHMVNKQMICCSFSYGAIGMSIPFVSLMEDYFSIDREVIIMEKIASILENPRICKIIQNAAFDVHIMLSLYGINIVNYEDTMIAQHCIAPDFPKGLDYICSMYTTIPYYKDDGKMFLLKAYGKWENLWVYSALDAIVLTISFPKQRALMLKHDHYNTYKRRLGQVPGIVYMQHCGVRVDIEKFRKIKEHLINVRDSNHASLIELIGHGLNYNSSKQLKEFLYVEKGLKPYKNKKGQITADKAALKSFKKPTSTRDRVPEVALILEAKEAAKLVSTYLQEDKIDPDGRIRASYNVCGTRYERLSSSKNIRGTGTNLQNIPHKILGAFVPSPGDFFISLDLSQAENRIVAYVANCVSMINAFETGVDIHSLTATMIMSVYYAGAIPEGVTVKTPAPIGDGKRPWRDWGKRANHGLNYGFGARAFALLNEVSEAEARFIVDSYHNTYKEVRTVFHTYVERCIKTNRYVPNLLGWKTPFLGELTGETYQMGYASIPQGSVGGIMGEVLNLWATTPEIYEVLKLRVQIHDSVGFTTKIQTEHEGWRKTAQALRRIIDAMERPLTTHMGLTFKIPADMDLGMSYEKEAGVSLKASKIPKDVDEFAKTLAEVVNELNK